MSVGDVATVVAAVVAVASLVGPVRAYYNRTVGRRFDLYRRFERLGVGALHEPTTYHQITHRAPTTAAEQTG